MSVARHTEVGPAVGLPVATPPAATTSAAGHLRLLLDAARPRQWSKNALVLAPPVAAGVWRSATVTGAAVAGAAFVLVSAAVYLANDMFDLPRDQLHPTKRLRAVASGRLPVSWAKAGAAATASAGLLLAAATDREALTAILAGYLSISVAYSAGLKAVPGLEILVVAAGFVWRPLAGGMSTGTHLSGWFLEVCCFAALTVAVGKRLAEVRLLRDARAEHRSALRYYRPDALRLARRLATAAAVGCYVGWAVSRWYGAPRVVALASAVPLALGLYRYAQCNDRGLGGAPEDLALTDRPLQALGLLWLVLLVAVSHA